MVKDLLHIPAIACDNLISCQPTTRKFAVSTRPDKTKEIGTAEGKGAVYNPLFVALPFIFIYLFITSQDHTEDSRNLQHNKNNTIPVLSLSIQQRVIIITIGVSVFL